MNSSLPAVVIGLRNLTNMRKRCGIKVEHEEWWNQRKHYYQRRRDLIVDWLRDRTELLNRVKNVFYEACMSKQLEDSQLENRQKQKELCDTLYRKVNNYCHY